MGKVRSLSCPRCGWTYEPVGYRESCKGCGAVLDVTIDLDGLGPADRDALLASHERGLFRWWPFLPLTDRASVVSLGEGDTPLLPAGRLGERLGLDRLYLKNDTVLPTGSLKDRSNAIGVSKAVELGVPLVAVVSTGNAAASVAAYAAAAGLRAVILLPEETAPGKVAQAEAYGAEIVAVRGDYDRTARLFAAAVREFGWYACMSNNPYRNEGKKSYAYELWEQLGGEVPEWLIHPTAGGLGLVATWKGFNELFTLGWVDRLPRMVAAQAAACAPIVEAYRTASSDVQPVAAKETVAESIRVGYPKSLGWRALRDIRKSGGTAVALEETEILEAWALLARHAGIYAEPAGAISLAAAARLRQDEIIGQSDLTVCMITGHGLKQPEVRALDTPLLAPIEPTLDSLMKRLEQERADAH
ncbi:MAG: threonine synthase [Candidatus Methylomirabilis sp.]